MTVDHRVPGPEEQFLCEMLPALDFYVVRRIHLMSWAGIVASPDSFIELRTEALRHSGELQAVGRLYPALQDESYLAKCRLVVGGSVGDDAIGRRVDTQAAHVSVVRREEHADVAGDAGEDHATHAKVAQEDLQGCAMEA